MVLFVFVFMMLNLGPQTTGQESRWLNARMWIGPAILALILILELTYVLAGDGSESAARAVTADQVGLALFGPYVLAVELGSMLLLSGLVGAYHLGHRDDLKEPGRGGE